MAQCLAHGQEEPSFLSRYLGSAPRRVGNRLLGSVPSVALRPIQANAPCLPMDKHVERAGVQWVDLSAVVGQAEPLGIFSHPRAVIIPPCDIKS